MTTLVLVHGCPGDASSWNPLGDFATIHAVTLPDHGADAPTATVRTHIDHVVATVQRESERVVLVGHSYGAWVAAHAAARVADRVQSLVLLAGVADVSGDTAAGLAGFAQALEAGALTAEASAQIAAQRWLGPDAPAEQFERIRALFVSEGATRLARQLRRTVTATERVTPSGVPTRVLAIENDAVVPRALSEELARTLGVSVELVPGASHFPHWNDAAALARALA